MAIMLQLQRLPGAGIAHRLDHIPDLRGCKITVRLENEPFPGVNQSFETLHG